jgi:ribosomal protein S18 acetylase RimI-like enzyme
MALADQAKAVYLTGPLLRTRPAVWEDATVGAAAVVVRPTLEDDRRRVVLLFAEVAEERVWIGTEPPVDIDARAASWILEGDFVAESDGEIVGSIHVQPSKHGYGEIGMAVRSGWRGRGIGTALMEAAIEWARENGLHKLSLSVFAHNEAAIALYRKFGFVEEGRRPRHYRRQSGEIWDGIDMGLAL